MGSGEAAPTVNEVTGVARVFGDGEKISEVILTYSEPLLASSVSPKDYVLSKGTLETRPGKLALCPPLRRLRKAAMSS